jgi:acetyl-CoA acetyltransferase
VAAAPRPIAVVGFGAEVGTDDGRSDAELLAPAVAAALAASGLDSGDIGVVGTASAEFLNGVVGGVMGAFDALPGWPPRTHSHLDGDGAFAFYECWVRLLAGEADAALVCAWSRPRAVEDPRSVLGLQLDPYLLGPLQPRPVSLAALQARTLIDSGLATEGDFAAVAAARRGRPVGTVSDEPYVAPPLRAADCSTICSGAAAVVLAAGDAASQTASRPAWIAGMEHRVERHALGGRDLSRSPTVEAMAAHLSLTSSQIDVLELHAPFGHQELILTRAIGAARVGEINPSGGALPADPIMATGLIRIGAAAESVMSGAAGRAVGHATNGPCLQHNLLCLLEGDRP